jgi:energy-dependent translational throttle protein EttA
MVFPGKETTPVGWNRKKSAFEKRKRPESARQKTLERELEWIRMSPKGRHAKSQARINSYEKLLAEETRNKEKELELFIPPGPRLGDVVIEAQKSLKLLVIGC